MTFLPEPMITFWTIWFLFWLILTISACFQTILSAFCRLRWFIPCKQAFCGKFRSKNLDVAWPFCKNRLLSFESLLFVFITFRQNIDGHLSSLLTKMDTLWQYFDFFGQIHFFSGFILFHLVYNLFHFSDLKITNISIDTHDLESMNCSEV